MRITSAAKAATTIALLLLGWHLSHSTGTPAASTAPGARTADLICVVTDPVYVKGHEITGQHAVCVPSPT